MKNKDCKINMVDAEFNYTFEYQGSVQKLVHTQLTDKCYLTLTQGLYLDTNIFIKYQRQIVFE